jgi:hypothetical protein
VAFRNLPIQSNGSINVHVGGGGNRNWGRDSNNIEQVPNGFARANSGGSTILYYQGSAIATAIGGVGGQSGDNWVVGQGGWLENFTSGDSAQENFGTFYTIRPQQTAFQRVSSGGDGYAPNLAAGGGGAVWRNYSTALPGLGGYGVGGAGGNGTNARKGLWLENQSQSGAQGVGYVYFFP